MVDVDWCDIDHGVYLMSDAGRAKVLDLVNSAVDIVELSVKIASKMLWLVLPGSDRAFLVWDGVAWIPLDGLFTKYWKVEIRIGQHLIYAHPLLNQPIGDVVRSMIEPYNGVVNGSEEWYYRDFDGAIRKGKDCTPPRGYRRITDFAEDASIAMLIIGILWALNSAGLYDWSSKLISKAMTYLRNKKIMTRISNTLDITEEVKESVIESGTDIDTIKQQVQTLGRRVGVRLALR